MLLYAAPCSFYFVLALLQLFGRLPLLYAFELLHALLRFAAQLAPVFAPPLYLFAALSLARLELHVDRHSSVLSLTLVFPGSTLFFLMLFKRHLCTPKPFRFRLLPLLFVVAWREHRDRSTTH